MQLPSTPLFAVSIMSLSTLVSAADLPLYRDPAQPVAARVEDLLGRMTLDEKIGQMSQYVGFKHQQSAEHIADQIPENDDSTGVYPSLSYAEIWRRVRAGEIGSFLLVVDHDEANRIQAAAQESRLGIPILFGIDAIHGHGFARGATVYPTPLNLAATFNPELVRRVAGEVAAELRAEGIHWTFTPNVDVARDPRWGRVGETFGEDPLLVGRLGAASVEGYRGAGPNAAGGVLTCLKHLLAGSEPANGLNAAAMDVSPRTLAEIHWPPYEDSVRAGADSVMLAHHALNGVPCHAHPELVADLRARTGFDGFVVSDWTDVARLATLHRVAASFKDAVELSLRAGLDLHMHGPGFLEAVRALVQEGRVSEARVDASVRRLLKVKFELGLFESARVDPTAAAAVVWQPAHRATALTAARQSLVLLKNHDGLLPLVPRAGLRVLLTGPYADNQAILGDWAVNQPDDHVTTIREGLTARRGAADVTFASVGDEPRTITDEAIAAAVAAAATADVVVAVVGESALRSQPLRTSGENHDRAGLDLPGRQRELWQALAAVGKPLVAVLVQSRPLGSPWLVEQAQALLVAGEPGALGGQAVAEALWGQLNPGGRLPISVARTAGQIPVYYNHPAAHHWRKYALEETGPLFEFGAGLSYTTFAYTDLTVPAVIHPGSAVSIGVTVANTGGRAGDDVVLAFVTDEIASVTTPVRALQAFARVTLAPGEARRVELTVPFDQLAIVTPQLTRVVEPGWFSLTIGDQTARFEVTAE